MIADDNMLAGLVICYPIRTRTLHQHGWAFLEGPVFHLPGSQTHAELTSELRALACDSRKRQEHGLDCEDQRWHAVGLRAARAGLN